LQRYGFYLNLQTFESIFTAQKAKGLNLIPVLQILKQQKKIKSSKIQTTKL
jgi:hypothetical protein